eukprot:GFYU01000018.1.p1 GENE.GFYU01000018.1~~GFYU01000018.1.p1  ORF type:complete len:251 (-),score=58.54 GFYU01000018.1:155-796(-)
MSAFTREYDYLFKFIIVGNSGVGKSALLDRFADNKFNPTHISTIGVDFKIKTIDIDGKIIKCQLWDTAGQERFGVIVQSYFRGTHACLFVFDVNDPQSLQDIRDRWYPNFVKNHSKGLRPQCLLVGNKCDQPYTETSCYEEAEDMAQELGMPFVITSALSGKNVDEAFVQIACQVKEIQPTIEEIRQTTVMPTAGNQVNSGGIFACAPSCSIM